MSMLALFTAKDREKRRQQLREIEQSLSGRWDLSHKFLVAGKGEANGLVEAVNLVFSRLHQFVNELTRRNVETATVAPLAQTIASKVRASSLSLAQDVEQIAQTCQRLADGIGSSSESASQALQQSGVIVKAIDQSTSCTQQALQRMESMEEEMARLTEAIDLLDRRSKAIGSIIESISEIADHTGLLSLNAFIEAARAGAHGAGFGVIAQEIRQLSLATAKSAQEVKDSLLGIGELIQQTVTAVARVRGEVNSGLEGNRQSSRAMGQVSRQHRQFHLQLESVIDAVADQKLAVTQLAGDLGRIATIGKEGHSDSIRLAELADKVKQLTDQQLLATGLFILPQYRKAEAAVRTMTELPEIRQPGPNTDQVLERSMRSINYLELIYLTDTSGVQISSNIQRNNQSIVRDTSSRGKNWHRKSWFYKVRETGRPHISELYKSEATDTFCLTISVPVYHGDKWVGVLGADINFEDLLVI